MPSAPNQRKQNWRDPLFGVFLISLLTWNCTPQAVGQCQTHGDCNNDEVCVDSYCRTVCNFNWECPDLLQCIDGACRPVSPAPSDAGALDRTAIDRTLWDTEARDFYQADVSAADLPIGDNNPRDRYPLDQGATDIFTTELGTPDTTRHDTQISGDAVLADQQSPDTALFDSGLPDVSGCPANFHDGGDGHCVALGTCSSGFSLYYLDSDKDSYGFGAISTDCKALPLPSGFSLVAGDCDDSTADLFLWMNLFADHDGDGFTGLSEQVCTDGEIPAGFFDHASPPPHVSFGPSQSLSDENQSGTNWSNPLDTLVLDEQGTWFFGADGVISNDLLLSDFGLQIAADAQIFGLRLHVIKYNSGAGDAEDQRILLHHLGASMGANYARSTYWPDAYTDFVYGGANDLWATSLTPAMLNDPSFGVSIATLSHGALYVWAFPYVDNVWLEVFSDAPRGDCDDRDDTVWSTVRVVSDSDGDGYGVGPEVEICVGQALPTGYAWQKAPDCYDSNPDAHPNQYKSFSTHRGDGSFDYDCDGVETQAEVSENTACFWYNACLASASEAISPVAACGHINSIQRCSGESSGTCRLQLTNVETPCR